ncbi:MAG: 4Fe-4S binding protein [Myxococcota bacterium]
MSTSAARARLQAADLRLRGALRYTWLRRAVLAGSILLTIFAPLAELGRLHGADGEGRFGALAEWLHLRIEPSIFIGAPWTVRLFGLEILDPVAAASLLFAAGPSWRLLWGALPALLLVAWLGRFFCGWLCPYVVLVAVGNLSRALLARFGLRTLDLRFPTSTAYVVLAAVLLVGLLSGTVVAPLFYPPAVVARELPRAIFAGAPTWGLGMLGLALGFDVLVSRAGFCRYLCPGGAMFRLIGRRSPVKIQREVAKCTDCTACDVVCNLLQSPMTDRTDAGCERCGKCVAVCPTDALSIGAGHPRLKVLP